MKKKCIVLLCAFIAMWMLNVGVLAEEDPDFVLFEESSYEESAFSDEELEFNDSLGLQTSIDDEDNVEEEGEDNEESFEDVTLSFDENNLENLDNVETIEESDIIEETVFESYYNEDETADTVEKVDEDYQLAGIGNYGVNLDSSCYRADNPFRNYWGQCTWFAWGRSLEKCGDALPCRGNAKDWIAYADRNPSANSVAVWTDGTYGHVAFVEAIENGVLYITEANRGNLGTYSEGTIRLSDGFYTPTYEGKTGAYYCGVPNGYIHLTSPVNHDPIIAYDGLSSNSPGTVTVTGWAYDPDDLTRSIDVHVYLFGQGNPIYLGATTANVSRKDVDNAFHVGEFHGYAATFSVPTSGNVDIDVAAINIGEGSNIFYPDHKYVNVASGVVFDVNFYVDGKDTLNLDGIGSIQVYVGGKIQKINGANSYTDFCQHVPANQEYKIKVNITNPDYYVYASGRTATFTGNTGSGNEVRIVICKSAGYEQVLSDGNYIIASATNPHYYLDIDGANKPAKDGENVAIGLAENNDIEAHDIWSIKYKDGFYYIYQYNNNLTFLSVFEGKALNGQNVCISANKGERWTILKNSDNSYRIKSECGGFSLDINGGVLSQGTNVQLWEENDSNAQKWAFIPYKIDYTIKYDAKGGINAPESQIVNDNGLPTITFTAPKKIPVKEGYRFYRWKDADLLNSFYPGDTVTLSTYGWNSNIFTFYAAWLQEYIIKYDANGGIEPPQSQITTYNKKMVLTTDVPTRNGYNFLGWSTEKNATTAQYQPGGICEVTSDKVLYAIWEKNDHSHTPVKENDKAATCTQNGYTGATTCSECGETLIARVIIPATGHDWGAWTVVKEATATTNGLERRVCKNDSSHIEEKVIKASETTGQTSLSVSSTSAAAGSEFSVKLSLSKNPGIAYLDFNLSYDKSKLSFVGSEDGKLTGWIVNTTSGKGVWSGDNVSSVTGDILTLKFKILDGVKTGSYEIGLSGATAYDLNDEVSVSLRNGSVKISDRLSGDVNEDNKVNGRDLIYLKQYLAGYGITINESNADVTGDGKVDGRDAVRLCRYFAGYDEKLA